MLNIKSINLSGKIMLGILTTLIIALGIYKGFNNHNIISHDEVWLTPFESIIITAYDLGDGFTSTKTTITVTEIISVKHSDKWYFSTEQWDEILAGITDGSVIWED